MLIPYESGNYIWVEAWIGKKGRFLSSYVQVAKSANNKDSHNLRKLLKNLKKKHCCGMKYQRKQLYSQ